MADPVATPPAAPAAPPVAATPAAPPVAAAPPATAPAAPPVAATPSAPAASPAPAPAAEVVPDLFAEPSGTPAAPPAPADPAKVADAPAAEYDLKLPDGLVLTTEELAEVKGTFAKSGVPPDRAQPLFDEWLAGMKTVRDSAVKQANDHWTQTQKDWQAKIKADPDIGGAKFDQSIAAIRKGAQAFLGDAASKELFTALNITGAGNHPAIVKAMHKAFSPHAPATPVNGAPAGQGTQRTPEATLYPTQVGLGNARTN